jgi:hypothetical protein
VHRASFSLAGAVHVTDDMENLAGNPGPVGRVAVVRVVGACVIGDVIAIEGLIRWSVDVRRARAPVGAGPSRSDVIFSRADGT